ncbi:hypothetical protein Syun_025641 [Stephania yunnanensis]|uniref:Uncharacterized protein n=1 Tax=Stephania yunnanensis TaxID=152371 RepID=A0AAP0HVY8_9MAGN
MSICIEIQGGFLFLRDLKLLIYMFLHHNVSDSLRRNMKKLRRKYIHFFVLD